MQNHFLALAIGTCLLASGCCHHGLLQKRQSEMNCPTDVRKTIPWCAGEDAVFRCPCGPSSHYYGHKPTCWGYWPTPGAEWRDTFCDCSNPYPTEIEVGIPTPATEVLPEAVERPLDESALQLDSLPPFETQKKPLFVAPPKTVSSRLPTSSPTKQTNNSFVAKMPAKETKRNPLANSKPEDGKDKQISYVEEQSLEAHSWTGLNFIR